MINKCTLLDCTNTEILRFLCTVHTYSTRLRFGIAYTHSFGTGTHTWRFGPLKLCLQSLKEIKCSQLVQTAVFKPMQICMIYSSCKYENNAGMFRLKSAARMKINILWYLHWGVHIYLCIGVIVFRQRGIKHFKGIPRGIIHLIGIQHGILHFIGYTVWNNTLNRNTTWNSKLYRIHCVE